jgi:hypothetical protein
MGISGCFLYPGALPCQRKFLLTPSRSRGTIMPRKLFRPPNPEHREAVRLSWKSRHIPFGTILIGGLALAGVLSAIFMVLAEGPANPPL